MKKTLLVTTALSLCLALSACNDDNKGTDRSSTYDELNKKITQLDVDQKQHLEKMALLEKQEAEQKAALETRITILQKALDERPDNTPEIETLKETLASLRKDLDGKTSLAPEDIKGFTDRIAALEKLIDTKADIAPDPIELRSLRPAFQSFTQAPGNFQLRKSSRIVLQGVDAALAKALQDPMGWVPKLRYATGLKLEVVSGSVATPGDIVLSAKPDKSLTETATFKWKTEEKPIKNNVLTEGYTYSADASNVTLTYNKNPGAIHALQTLYQLLGSDQRSPGDHRWLPAGKGLDYPVYEFRGVMFDVGRQFVSVDDLIGFMDKMSFYKLNVLHLHLSDNVGKGDGTSFKVSGEAMKPQDGPNGYLRLYDDTMPAELKLFKPTDSPSDGADRTYYTKADIKRLEAAGAKYGIEIVPEIDTPGHSYFFTNVFPNLRWAQDHSVIDVRNPEAVKYMTKLAIELGGWFTSKKFHIGGDEAYHLPESELNKYLEKMQDDLSAAGIGTELFGAWTNWGGVGLSKDFTIFNWTGRSASALKNRKHIAGSWDHYFIPYLDSERSPQSAFNGLKGYMDNAGIPIGAETYVWNDLGEKLDYGFDAINAGIRKSLPGFGYGTWSGLPLKAQDVVAYAELPAENIATAREYSSAWLRDKFQKLDARTALDILQRAASHKQFIDTDPNPDVTTLGLSTSNDDPTDPLGWDPLDMAAAFKKAEELVGKQTPDDKGVLHVGPEN